MADKYFESHYSDIRETLVAGKEIGRYTIKQFLGAGGSGLVLQAIDNELQREVALKFLPPFIETDEDSRNSILKEARVMAALLHPNVVAVFDIGEWRGRPFITMEYVSGESLREILATKHFSIREILLLLKQICAGLEKIHSAGVVHCDIKPSNILITGDGTAKIADFGISRLQRYPAVAERELSSGTITYMSPEQALGEVPGPQSDIFSLGVVMYELIAGRPPFTGNYAASLIYSIVNSDPTPLSELNEECPIRLRSTVEKALAKDKANRYQSVAELARDLSFLLTMYAETTPGSSHSLTTKVPADIGLTKEVTEASHSDLRDGVEIGRYQIIRKIGAGGMGEVFLADDMELRRKVALKFLPARLVADQDCAARFKREAQAAAMLNHPNIVTIHEVCESNGRPFIVMEYAERHSLRELMLSMEISLEQIIEWGIEICEGLSKAHQAGIVHRDIKPGNILIDSDGRAKICDFGMAMVKGRENLTKSGAMLGTPHYMSPEQVRGEKADGRSDLYSFGVILYQMITGGLPFERDYEAALLYSIVNEPAPRLKKAKPDVPERISLLVETLLQKQASMRYQNASDVARELRAIQRGASPPDSSADESPPLRLLNSVAVLPFADMSFEHDQEYFCDGIAEEILSALSRIPRLRVAARTSAFQFKGKNLDIRKIGESLGVSTVLEGSVRKVESRIRISAQLINVSDGCHLWSEIFDRKMEDVFLIQDEIARAISSHLMVTLAALPGQSLISRHTDSPEAYNFYLKGRYFWNRRYSGGLQRAIEFFQKAIALDPTYARAYAGVADSYNIIGFYNFLPPHDACPKARSAVSKALEIDATLAEAHTALGWTHTFYDWDWVAAEADFRHSLELNPNYAMTHHYYGLLLVATGHFEDGLVHMQKAVELDPLSLIITASYGGTLYFARQAEEGYEQTRKVIELDPNFALAHAYFAGPCVSLGKHTEAVSACREAVRLASGGTYAMSMLGYALTAAGMPEEALQVAQDLERLAAKQYVSSYHLALVYTGLGESDKALGLLEQSLTERDNWMVWLGVHPAFDPLRDHPRFSRLLKEVGLAETRC